ncbi:MAG: hypothetical protein JJU19_13315 [Pararhodobacter sp.]|nr:hypothetical protein [Pararhodobacter sp.]
MSKIDSAEVFDLPVNDQSRDGAPNGAGVVLAVVTGTLFWAGLILLFI